MNKHLAVVDCYPDKAQYFEGDIVNILLEAEVPGKITEIDIAVTELEQIMIRRIIKQSELTEENSIHKITFELPYGNYGVDVKVIYAEEIMEAHTAFDVAGMSDSLIRYGFLTDFSEAEKEVASDITFAVKLHLNALQFYDWMYRHDKLVADVDAYLEPLGREISLHTIRNKVALCKDYGIRPFAYGAIYAASKEAYKEHPDWALYKKDKDVLCFADWLVFMDTSNQSPWFNYIIGQFADAVRRLGFQGIHMDTYGFPKHVWNDKQERISLAETFPGMIRRVKQVIKEIDEKSGVIFNSVNNWPVEYVATSVQDAAYIEVWPPHVTYHHLYSLIREAKYLGAKQVILAAYMSPFKEAKTEKDILAAECSLLLTNAVIQASGGTQLVFGETKGILCDSYYVNYATMRDNFILKVRSYCDFGVRYGKLLYNNNAMDISMTAANGINEDITFAAMEDSLVEFSSCGEAGKIWTIIRETKQFLTLQLINLSNVNDLWNQPKPQSPIMLTNIQVDILMDTNIKGVYAASPDDGTCTPVSLEYRFDQKPNGQHIIVTIPKVELWDLIWVELM